MVNETDSVPGQTALAPHEATPLVGRAAERERVAQGLGALATGVGALILISGEPGIGKRRL